MTDDDRRPARQVRGPFGRTHPCSNCPFRSDREFHLAEGRREEIAESLRGDEPFHCHKTLDYTDEGPQRVESTVFCAGALKTVENGGERDRNALMQVGERLGLYDPARLQEDMPVYGSLDEWIAEAPSYNRERTEDEA